MSDEQQQQSQQRQQQLQLQQQNQKNSKDMSTSHSACKTNINDLRNQDYVSRLMAATPPYLYSAPIGPNNYFFSDMLRTLVQARNNENARNLQMQQSVLSRRPRKRSWSQHRLPYYEQLRDRKETEEKHNNLKSHGARVNSEKPLELTNKSYFQLQNKCWKLDETVKDVDVKLPITTSSSETLELEENGSNPTTESANSGSNAIDNVPSAASLPPQDLVLPPPPPVWYPPLYSPYGIDPLHFFIDLRVSGHIYDRKKENVSPLTSTENSSPNNENGVESNVVALPNKQRHGSAFTVPVPRSNDIKSTVLPSDAINLVTTSNVANKFENYVKYYDLGETKENHPVTKSSTSYMLQHLPRLYQFAARDLIAAEQNTGCTFDIDNKSDADCDADSDGRNSVENCNENVNNRERDIDVEIIDTIKYRTDVNSSRCTSPDGSTVAQID
ncbi:uncharacterized protein LOC119673301 [Teleopsis dalmanni]|uniref:uncharacterized protein LOC119673300 n=1 Tax=Teleopsis dalmanni TaxID=139649 RepID=UPI0018CD7FF0|nr:uncharacterized protein LOC119673300 [Teleopsis dalmanni]XP_037940495.1 uncharacterized protein LOC119673301 [Teleopsis dalmanni]